MKFDVFQMSSHPELEEKMLPEKIKQKSVEGAEKGSLEEPPQPNRKCEGKKVILNLIKNTGNLTTDLDGRSQKGQFGWITIGEQHVPYIFRSDSVRFIGLRIVNQVVYSNYFRNFRQEFFDMFIFASFTMTDFERALYNEINVVHCNCAYGINTFQRGEQVVALDDVLQFYDFITFLYRRLILKKKDLHLSYGYMYFNDSSIVPFVTIDGQKCFPAWYFEGDENFLKHNSKTIGIFHDAALRVLIRLQKVGNPTAQIRVITMDDVKLYFEKNGLFKDTWVPQEADVFTAQLRANEGSLLRIVNADLPIDGHGIYTIPMVKVYSDKVTLYAPNNNGNVMIPNTLEYLQNLEKDTNNETSGNSKTSTRKYIGKVTNSVGK